MSSKSVTRVIFVNRYFFPDISATSQVLSDLAFALAKEDAYEIHVVTSRLAYDDPGTRFPSLERTHGVRVCRVWTSRFGRKNMIGRFLDYVTFYPSAFFALLRLLRRGDVGVAKTDPPLICVPVWLAAWLRGALLVNWLQDFFPEVAVALGIRASRGALGWILTWLRDCALKFAAINVVLGQRMVEMVHRRGISHDRIMEIPNWADGEAVRPLSRDANPLRITWELAGKFVVGYSGNLGRAHEVATILSAAEMLRGDSSIVLLFIGSGHGHALLRAEVTQRRLTNVIFRPYQVRDQLRLTLTLPDVHLVSLLPELEGLIVPSKFYGVVAAGRPVAFIGAPNGELADQISRYGCGLSIAPGDAVGLANFLRKLHADPVLKEQMGRNARAAFEANFDKMRALAKWRRVLADATNFSYRARNSEMET